MVQEYSYGTLYKVRDFANTVTYWQANKADARGAVTQETLGNGLITTRSIDAATGLPSYIKTGTSPGASGIQNLNYVWDAVGNLSSRNDANQGLTEAFVYDNLYLLDYSTLNGTHDVTPKKSSGLV